MQILSKKIKLFLLCFLLALSLYGCSLKDTSENKITWEKWLEIVALDCGYAEDLSKAIETLDLFMVIKTDEFKLDEELSIEMIEFTVESLITNSKQAKEVLKEMGVKLLDEASIKAYVALINDALNNPKMDQQSTNLKLLDYYDKTENKYFTEDIYNVGDIVIVEDELFVVDKHEEDSIELIPFSEEDTFGIYEELEVDFDDIEIEVGGYYLLPPSAGIINTQIKKHRLKNYDISYSYSSSSIHFNIENVAENSLPIFFQFNVNNIKPIIKFERKGFDIESAFLKIKFSTILQAGIKKSHINEKVFDFTSIGSLSLEDYFKKNDLSITDSLHIATLKIPISNIPTCTINLKIYLNFYANGKIEVSLFENQEIGFEYINGQMRTIKESQKELSLLTQAKGSVTSNIELSANLMNVNIMDVYTEFGVEAQAKATLTPHSEELVLLCTDLMAYWVWDIGINSKNSVLGKLNLSKTLNLVNEENGKLFPNSKHIENFMIVEKCTRNSLKLDREDLELTERIRLGKYLYILGASDTQVINIISLPSGYLLSDVIVEVINTEVVNVYDLIIYPSKTGITNIIIKTNDGLFSVELTVIVK